MRFVLGEAAELAVRDAPALTPDGGAVVFARAGGGLAVRPLNGNERELLGTTGRLVVEDADGPAAIAGVERGDVILAVNEAPVSSLGEFRSAVNASGETVALLIQRGNAQIFVPVRIDF